MAKPQQRPNLPPRRSNNNKRRLLPSPDPNYVADLQHNIIYKGSPKHKENPQSLGLAPFNGDRGDASLCDRHANFRKADMRSIPRMIRRGLQAELIGQNDIIWAIASNGWIYEARVTNTTQTEYHGYPVRSSEPIAEMVYKRFSDWVKNNNSSIGRQTVRNCKNLYGFK